MVSRTQEQHEDDLWREEKAQQGYEPYQVNGSTHGRIELQRGNYARPSRVEVLRRGSHWQYAVRLHGRQFTEDGRDNGSYVSSMMYPTWFQLRRAMRAWGYRLPFFPWQRWPSPLDM